MSSHTAQSSSSRQAERSYRVFECIICMDVLINPRMLPCGHSFCSSPKPCLSKVLKMKKIPQCASCNHKLPLNISEDDVPKNYTLSSAIEETQASSGDGSKCPIHQKDREFYCRQCSALICYLCWSIEHKDKNKHEVEPFFCTSERYFSLQNNLAEFRQETEKLSEMLNRQAGKCSELLDEIHNTEVVMKNLLCSGNPVSMSMEAYILRKRISDAHFKLSDVEALPMVFLQEQLKYIRSKLMTTTEWEVTPEVPLTEKIHVSLKGDPWLAETDIAQKNLYVCFTEPPGGTKVHRYEMDGESFTFRKEMVTSVEAMCVVNDRLVVLPVAEANKESKLKILDKNTLEKIDDKEVALLKRSFKEPPTITIAGYTDVLVVLVSSLDVSRPEYQLAVLRGEHHILCEEISWKSEICSGPGTQAHWKEYIGISLCNNRTIMAYERNAIHLFDFDKKRITRARCIRIRNCVNIHDIAFKSLPMSSPLKGYLFIKEKIGSKPVTVVKVDIESVEDGAVLSDVMVPELNRSKAILLHLPQAVLYYSTISEKYWMLFVR